MADGYIGTYPFITHSKLGKGYVHCKSCKCDFSTKHGGKYDIARHMQTEKHKKYSQYMESPNINKLEKYFDQPNSDITSENQKVITAECLMTNFIIEHNLPVVIADHMSDLIKKLCPDSTVAKKYQCKRTKTTHIHLILYMEWQEKCVEILVMP